MIVALRCIPPRVIIFDSTRIFYKEKIMKKIILAFVSLMVLCAGTALAENKGYDQKTVLDNDRVRVLVVSWKPGAESPSVPRELDRVVYAVKGGTIQRNYDDGSSVRYTYKTGDVIYADRPEDKKAYSIKNVGKSTIVLQAVFLK
jgi:hypothetical protein